MRMYWRLDYRWNRNLVAFGSRFAATRLDARSGDLPAAAKLMNGKMDRIANGTHSVRGLQMMVVSWWGAG